MVPICTIQRAWAQGGATQLAPLRQTQQAPTIDPELVADADWVEDSLFIDRVDGNNLWFEGDIGPLKVSAVAAKLAQPG